MNKNKFKSYIQHTLTNPFDTYADTFMYWFCVISCKEKISKTSKIDNYRMPDWPTMSDLLFLLIYL